ncbi:MAG TPA: hypothetical protein VMZ91_05570 [Candidatus Paceibacterota bacterium]|nr:hypothetical protein [Candidatus Paceibacterota bacterium]
MKKYTIEVIFENGVYKRTRTNEGFNPYELLGIFELSKMDIIEQMKGNIRPNEI